MIPWEYQMSSVFNSTFVIIASWISALREVFMIPFLFGVMLKLMVWRVMLLISCFCKAWMYGVVDVITNSHFSVLRKALKIFLIVSTQSQTYDQEESQRCFRTLDILHMRFLILYQWLKLSSCWLRWGIFRCFHCPKASLDLLMRIILLSYWYFDEMLCLTCIRRMLKAIGRVNAVFSCMMTDYFRSRSWLAQLASGNPRTNKMALNTGPPDSLSYWVCHSPLEYFKYFHILRLWRVVPASKCLSDSGILPLFIPSYVLQLFSRNRSL